MLLISPANANYPAMPDIRPPDPFDRAILRIIQRAMAQSVNLSTAAVQRRIAAMDKAGMGLVIPSEVGLGG